MDVQSAQMASPVAQENAYLSEDYDQDSQLEIQQLRNDIAYLFIFESMRDGEVWRRKPRDITIYFKMKNNKKLLN